MKTEIVEALALELTKAIIADQAPLSTNKMSAEHWVKTYKDSLEKINTELNKDRKKRAPVTAGKTTS